MAKIELHRPDQDVEFLDYVPGSSLRDILDAAQRPVRTACLGHGACGLCRVRLDGDALPPPTPAERLHLSAAHLAEGVRLACQVKPDADLRVAILNPALPSHWRTMSALPKRAHAPQHIPPAQRHVRHPLGLAIDLGTTNIRVALLDLKRGTWLGQCKGSNPQRSCGADVISRLTVAATTAVNSQTLAMQAINAIGEALQSLSSRLGVDLQRIIYAALVGNSSMLTLISATPAAHLLNPDNWAQALPPQHPDTDNWRARWGIHAQAEIEIIQALAGFVGSDLLAALVAVAFDSKAAPALLVDFGTNSEIALWDGEQLWVTSAAGGPAFEVSGYRAGMPAENGAICRVQINKQGHFDYTVLGGGAPQGLCGSGLIDLIACLRHQNILHKSGRLRASFSLPNKLEFGASDIDNLQQAKAAIAAGIEVLCQSSGVRPDALARVCVAGEFGRYLNVNSAIAIGLLPPVAPHQLELYPEAALLGCADVVFSREAAQHLHTLRARAHLLNLASTEAFASAFVRHLYLQTFPAP
jgi:uncharacterized 2Fe-2S/4Fe-4S cluster protein (DUF4445 family)